MKIVCLNTFSGYFFGELNAFIKEHAPTTDVFMFQEIYNGTSDIPDKEGHHTKIFSEIEQILPDFKGNFSNTMKNCVWKESGKSIDVPYGNATFVKSGIQLHQNHSFYLPSAVNTFSQGKALVTELNFDGVEVTLCNVHGCAAPGDKRDCPERIRASQEIIEFMGQFDGHKIIAGDFNLFPDTKSIELFEEAQYRNLILDHKISTTRGTLLKQLHPEYGIPPNAFQEFADYMFVSEGVQVVRFDVPDVPVSDHLPLILECNF